jgi:TIR domain
VKTLFISYAHEDRAAAETLAKQLESEKQSEGEPKYIVWWDEHLPAGTNIRNEIRTRLEQADKVIVIWSPSSEHALYVLEEAEWARDAGKLIQTMKNLERPPYGFGQHKWIGLEEFGNIVRAIDTVSPVGAVSRSATPNRLEPSQRVQRSLGTAIFCLAGLTAFAVIAAYVWFPRGCDVRGLEPALDYRCYHSKYLGVEFIWPQGALTLVTTKEHDQTLTLINRDKEIEVRITRTPLPAHGDIRRARDAELHELRSKGYDDNELKPKPGEAWRNFYVITGHKPNTDEFYYKRWHTQTHVLSVEFDYSRKKIELYNRIIEDMMNTRPFLLH